MMVLVIGFVSKAQTPFSTPNLLTGGATKITQNKGAGQFDSGMLVKPRFTDTASANLSVVSLYGGMLINVLDTIWMRDNTATKWIKQGGGSGGGGGSQTWQQTLTTGSTLTGNNTIDGGAFDLKFNNTDFHVGNLGGDNEKVVWTDNNGLLYRTTFPILSDSLNPYITGLQNGVISGCTVTWIQNYDYEVSPCTYRIGGIVYNIPTSTSITLTAADPTNGRIDVFYVNTSSVAAVAQGTPANPAEEPDIDVATQLKISFAVVEAATTQPTLDIDVIYKENAGPPTEWTYSDNTANLNPASTTNPYEGTFDIEATNVTSGNQFTMTVSPTPVFTDYVFLNFKIRSKATWASGRVMAIQFFNGATPVGSTVVFGQGTYGFQSNITANYQNISIPLSDFGNITGATSVRFIRNGSSTIGFYIDNIILLEARSYVVPYIDQVVGIAPIEVNQVGSLAEVSLQGNGVTNDYIRQSAGLSVIGNSTNATANVADITAGTDHYVLRRSGTSLGFGVLNAAAMNPTYTNGYTLQTDGSGNLSWVAGGSSGTVTSIATTSPISGGTITTTGTISLDTTTAAGGWHSTGYYDARYKDINYSAITSLGGLTASTQTFATGTSGTDFNISSATSTHTFNIPDASASARGLITTGSQIIAGDKVLTGNNTYTGSGTFNGALYFRGLTNGASTDSLVTINGHQIYKLNLQNQSPWWRTTLSGASATTNIVQTRTIADTIVTGGNDVIGSTNSPLYKFNHSGTMGIFRNNIGVTSTPALVLRNTQSATNSLNQWTPSLQLIGQYWDGGSLTSKTNIWFIEAPHFNRATTNMSSLIISNQSEDYGKAARLTISSNGTVSTQTLSASVSVEAPVITSSGTLSVTTGSAFANLSLGNYITTSGRFFNTTGNFAIQGFTTGSGFPSDTINRAFVIYRGTQMNGYSTGSSVTSGSATLTGATNARFYLQYVPGETVVYNGESKTINSINSNTAMTMSSNYAASASNLNASAFSSSDGVFFVASNGKVGIRQRFPTAFLHLPGGFANAEYAPLKFTSGTNLTTPEAGAMEFDGTNLYFTPSSTRLTADLSLTGSATLDFGNTAAQNSADLTITVTGAADGDVVSLGVPNTAVNANSCFTAWVSAANTVTVRFNNYSSGAIDPASATFKIRVNK